MKKSRKLQPDNKNQVKAKSPLKAMSDAAQGLRDLFVNGLKDIYWAENALSTAIPKMIINTSSKQLSNALTGHLEENVNQIERLDRVFSLIRVKSEAKKCDAMAGLTKKADEIMSTTQQGVVRDAGIIYAGQKVDHYKIATYGTLCSFAKILGEEDAANLLEESLNEEKAADIKLSKISNSINISARKKV